MKNKLCILLAIFLTVFYCGCSSAIITTIEEYEQTTITNQINKTSSNSSTKNNSSYAIASNDVSPVATLRQQTSKVCYDTLSSEQKQVYKTIEAAAKNVISEKIYIDYAPEKNDVYVAFRAVLADHPEFFWVSDQIGYVKSGKESYLHLLFNMNESEIALKKTQFNTKIASIQNSIRGSTDYQTVLSIHDFLCDSIVYTDKSFEPSIYTVWGALMSGEAVCEGYAEAMMYLCNLYGIDCIVVSGKDKNDQPHMWNQVKMAGQWYNVDVTFDDTNGSNYYAYFGLSNSLILEDHTFFPSLTISIQNKDAQGFYNFKINVCNSTDLNYFNKNNRVLTDQAADSKKVIINTAVNDILNGNYNVDFGFINFISKNLSGQSLEEMYAISECIVQINEQLKFKNKSPARLKSYSFIGTSVRLSFEEK